MEREAELEKPLSLDEQRRETVVSALKESGAARLLDLGCGEGKLLKALLANKQFTEIVGMDVVLRCSSPRSTPA
ncbi:MAG TPA: class I SAM-dependent methyltransferase [Myxococcales bacterium]